MIKKIVTLLICLMPVTFMGQVLKQHQHEESSGTGLGNGEVFSPFRDNPTDSTKKPSESAEGDTAMACR